MAVQYGTLGNDVMLGTAGNDTQLGLAGADQMLGFEGIDNMFGGTGNDVIFGGTGNDILQGNAGNDQLFGESGIDSAVFATNTNVSIIDGQANSNGLGADQWSSIENFSTGGGSDFVALTAATANVINTNGGNDFVVSGDGNDTINGGSGNDDLLGEGGNDTVNGGNDNDSVFGNNGNDVLNGGNGIDLLTGGTGADDFQFAFGQSGVGDGNRDEIVDFSHAQGDDIDLSEFAALDFIGQSAFSAAGQVRFSQSGGDTIVAINTVGSSGAEMQIELNGNINLVAGDFIL